MKYVNQLKAKLLFHRGIPLSLRSVAGKANFSRARGLDAATATAQQILEARIETQRIYDLYLKTLKKTSVNACADNDIEALAADVLRRNKAAAGQYAPHMLGPKLQENDPVLTQVSFAIKQHKHATTAVPEHIASILKLHEEGNLKTTLDDDEELVHTPTRNLTAQEEAVQRAWEACRRLTTKLHGLSQASGRHLSPRIEGLI